MKLLAPASFRISAGKLAERRAEGSRRARRDRARGRHVDRLGSGEAARRPARRWSCRSTTAAAGRRRRRPRPGRPASTRSRRRSPVCTECVSRLCRGSPRDFRDRSSFGEAVRARGRRGGAPCACCGCRTLRRRCADDRRPSASARALPNAESLAPIPALVVDQAAPPRLADLPGATYVERLGSRRLAFVPNDPLAAKQWHLNATRAFDFWDSSALALALPPVRVAIIDSGIDATHPELADKIVEAKSFVGGSASVDHEGHGTFVAGLIAAAVDNSAGIAGMAPSAELLIAKVVVGGDVIDVEAEAKAIKLGGAERREGDQPEPRWPPRPAQPRPRHVLAARGGCCRLRATGRASWSSRRSGTPSGAPPSRGRTRATRPRCRTSSASARSLATAPSPCSRTATRSTTTSQRRGPESSRPCRSR